MPIVRYLAVIAIVIAVLLGPAVGGFVAPHMPIAHADEGKDEPGKGNQGKNDEKEDEKEKKDKKEKEDKENKGRGNGKDDVDKVVSTVGYSVEVSCTYDSGMEQTTCTFTGVAPDGGKDVGHVDLLAESICTEVIGGDAEYVDPDPNTRVVGYKSRGSEGRFTLQLAGEVTTGGTATYWFKTGNGVFPATGPGLVCGATLLQSESDVPAPTATADTSVAATEAPQLPTGTAVPATTPEPTAESTTYVLLTPDAAEAMGSIRVVAYACSTTPTTADFDWYGECAPAEVGARFRLERRTETSLEPVTTTATDANAEVRFGELESGAYRLTQVDADWCHAESDSVDETGDVLVEGGQVSNVWVFTCATG